MRQVYIDEELAQLLICQTGQKFATNEQLATYSDGTRTWVLLAIRSV